MFVVHRSYLPTGRQIFTSLVRVRQYGGAVHRAYTEYRKRYQHTAVNLEKLQRLEQEMALRLKVGIASIEVRPRQPEAFQDEFGTTLRKFAAIAQEHEREIRKFYVVFSADKFTNRAACVCLDLLVRNQGHFGEPEPKEIVLAGFNCYKHDFEAYCRIAEEILGLIRAPSKGSTNDSHGFLVDRLAVSIENQALANVIRGPLSTKDYDGAVRAAIVLVEHELRARCVAAGRSESRMQSGSDLAITAFNEKTGCLIPPWSVSAQANEGVHLAFRGFFLHLRNAWGHNATVAGPDASGVDMLIEHCQYLLHLIGQSKNR